MNYKVQAIRSPTPTVTMVETTAWSGNGLSKANWFLCKKGAEGRKGERRAGENRGEGR